MPGLNSFYPRQAGINKLALATVVTDTRLIFSKCMNALAPSGVDLNQHTADPQTDLF